jgi:hypothetical protein
LADRQAMGLSDVFHRTSGVLLLLNELSGFDGIGGGGGVIWVLPGVHRRDGDGRAGRVRGGG